MSFSAAEIETLGLSLAKAGLPLLATMLATIAPPPIGAIAEIIMPSISAALGLAPGATPADVTAAINADPNGANAKLAQVQEANSSLLDFAKVQADLDTKEADSGSLFVSGWRPAFGWLCVITTAYQMAAAAVGYGHVVPPEVFNPVWYAFGGMLGLRSVEKWFGVARVVMGTKR